jgi:predicted AlkP superfamily pyrophosphatase or phosphodiesterase
MPKRKVVVIDIAALSLKQLQTQRQYCPHLAALCAGGRLLPMRPVFPAVTLPVQASLTSGTFPEAHGVVANGFYWPQHRQVSFWEQPATLVQSERLWTRLKRRDPKLRSAALFMQNTLYADVDIILTPRPLHTDDGLVEWCYGKPVDLYDCLTDILGPFPLRSYWGPLASIESSRWIAGAAVEVLQHHSPDLLFVYLPHLDYCQQKLGPNHPAILPELILLDAEVGRIVDAAHAGSGETAIIVLSEYAMQPVRAAIPINLLLRERGLLAVRRIAGREYLDLELSQAFAMVDHQVAHIYHQPQAAPAVRSALEGVDGIDLLLDQAGLAQYRLGHRRAGDLVAVSARDRWFAYPWWRDTVVEPDFAGRIDIHRKPGYDPLELFLEPGSRRIAQDTSLIGGSHGYPPLSEADLVPFLLSDASLLVERELCVTDVAGVIEGWLFGE